MKNLSMHMLYATLFLYLLTGPAANAQVVSDTLSLGKITIQATRNFTEKDQEPVKTIRFSSDDLKLFTGNSITDILEQYSLAGVRNYGIGGLATVSQRGYTPVQTQILMNGFYINDPMNGLIDFSLIPSNFLHSMELSAGNSSSAYGNAAAGGTIYLDTSHKHSGISVWQTIGSFGNMVTGVSTGLNKGNWHAGAMFQMKDSDNDYSFTADGNESTREHNSLESLNLMVNGGYTSGRLSFNTTLWMYDVENQAPGSLQFPSVTAVQTDEALRWMNRLAYQSGNLLIEGGVYLASTKQVYSDEAFAFESKNNTNTLSFDLLGRYDMNENLRITQVATFSNTSAETSNYGGEVSQITAGYQLNPVWKVNDRLRLFSGIRYDYYETAGDAVSASLGANYSIVDDRLIVRGQLSRNFVAPTFNDLYWVPSGNPGLKAETNRKGEIGLLHRASADFMTLESDITLFAGRHFDGVRWLFDADQGFFRAQNIDEIYSRGVELTSRQFWSTGSDFRFGTSAGIIYNRSTIEADAFEDDRTVGKQLVYTPELRWNAGIDMQYRSVRLGLNYHVTGERYSSQDHSSAADPLDSFGVLNLFVNANIDAGVGKLNINTSVRNLLDEQYQFINGYPMPGRYVQLTLRADLFSR
jgi:iron complex outermembrane receptor protein